MPLLERRGHKVDAFPLLGDDYLLRLFARQTTSLLSIVISVTRRFRDIFRARRYDVVVVEKELVPWLPTWFERILLRLNPHVIVDYDDAVYVRYAKIPILRSKISWLMRHSRAVVAGNCYIAEYALRYNANTFIIPTVVDVAKYHPRRETKRDNTIEVVWIGTPVTSRLLHSLALVFAQLTARYPRLYFKFIGAGDQFRMDGVRLRIGSWSEEREAQELAEADIGIMPLEDTDFQRGKCALKIIQYMAAGLPVVASPVGANVDVVREGEAGFLAGSDEEWIKALTSLIENESLRKQLGQNGRKRAEDLYSLQVALPMLEAVFRRAASAGRTRNSPAASSPTTSLNQGS